MKRDQILAALPALKPNDLKAILRATEGLLGEAARVPKAKAKTAPEGPTGWLYDGLLGATGLTLSWNQFAPSQAGKQFTKWAPDVVSFAQSSFPEQMIKKASGYAIIRLLLDLILADLRKRKIPVTLNTITIHMQRVQDIFNDAFPGYLETGLGSLIAKQMTRQ